MPSTTCSSFASLPGEASWNQRGFRNFRDFKVPGFQALTEKGVLTLECAAVVTLQKALLPKQLISKSRYKRLGHKTETTSSN